MILLRTFPVKGDLESGRMVDNEWVRFGLQGSSLSGELKQVSFGIKYPIYQLWRVLSVVGVGGCMWVIVNSGPFLRFFSIIEILYEIFYHSVRPRILLLFKHFMKLPR